MDPKTIQAFCQSGEFTRIEAAVREWPGVEAVGSLRAKENRKDITTVFIKFDSEDTARKSISLFNTVPGLSQTTSEKKNKEFTTKKSTSKVYPKNLAAEFMHFETHEERKQVSQQRGKGRYENNQRGTGGRGGNRFYSGKQEGRGNKRQSNFIPPVKVCVAFADNVPFNMTNEQLIEVFSPYGRVLDISRYELMLMVFYESQEAVALAIQNVNGKTVKGNVVSVSSGSIKIPGPVALQMGVQVP